MSFAEQRSGSDDASSDEITQMVRWKAPRGKNLEIRIYGVADCVAKPAVPDPGTQGPCLIEHTPLPKSVRTLLAAAPASDGVASWSWVGTFDCGDSPANPIDGPAYRAVVLAAYDESGHSKFAIAEPGVWWEPAEGEIIC